MITTSGILARLVVAVALTLIYIFPIIYMAETRRRQELMELEKIGIDMDNVNFDNADDPF